MSAGASGPPVTRATAAAAIDAANDNLARQADMVRQNMDAARDYGEMDECVRKMMVWTTAAAAAAAGTTARPPIPRAPAQGPQGVHPLRARRRRKCKRLGRPVVRRRHP